MTLETTNAAAERRKRIRREHRKNPNPYWRMQAFTEEMSEKCQLSKLFTNPQIHKYTNTQIHKCTNAQIHKYTSSFEKCKPLQKKWVKSVN